MVWLVVLVLLPVVLFFVVTRSAVTRWVLTGIVSSRLGVPVEARSVTLGLDGLVTIRGAVIRTGVLKGEADEFVRVGSLVVRVPWWDVTAAGGPAIESVVADGVVVRVSQSSVDSTMNVPPFRFVGGGGGGVRVPMVEIVRAGIEVGEHGEGGAWTMLRRAEVSGRVLPDAVGDRYTFELTQEAPPEGSTSVMSIVGRIDRAGVHAELVGLDISGLAGESVPTSSRALFTRLDLKGEVTRATFDYRFPSPGTADPLREMTATLQLRGVAVTLPFRDLAAEGSGGATFPRMTGVTGAITLQGGTLSAALDGRLEDLPYVVTLEYRGLTPDSPFEAVLESKGFLLQERPRLGPFLPPAVHKRLRMFSNPTGVVDSRVVVSRGAGDGQPSVAGAIDLRDGVASFIRFPYQFRQMEGRIEFDDTTLRIVRLNGRAVNGATIDAKGTISPLTDEAAVSLEIEVKDIPVDEMLERGLGERRRGVIDALFNRERYQELLAAGLIVTPEDRATRVRELAAAQDALDEARQRADGSEASKEHLNEAEEEWERAKTRATVPVFELGGRGRALLRLETAFGKDMPWTQDITIDIPAAGLVPKRFPLPVLARDVRLHVDDDALRLEDGRFGAVRGGEATVRATADFSSSGPSTGGNGADVTITARGVPLDDLLINAIPAKDRALGGERDDRRTLGSVLRDLRLDALGDAEVWIGDTPDGQAAFRATVSLAQAACSPVEGGEAGLREIGGTITVDDDRLKLNLVGNVVDRAGADAGLLSVDTKVEFSPTRYESRVLVDDLESSVAVEEIIRVFSPRAARAVAAVRERYEPSGPADVEARLEGEGDDETDVDVTLTSPRGIEFAYRPEKAGPAPVRVKAGPVDGAIRFRTKDGASVRFEQVAADIAEADTGRPLGRLSIDGRLGIGESEEPDTADLRIAVDGGRFESALTRAVVEDRLGDRFPAFYAERNPRGEFDVSIDLGRDRADSPWRVRGRLTPRSLSVHSGGVDVECPRAEGQVTFTEVGGELRDVRLGHDEWSLALSGGWDALASGATVLNLRIDAESKGLPGSLRALMPETVRTMAADLSVEASGEVRFRGVEVSMAWPAADGAVEPTVEVRGVTEFAGGGADVGVVVSDASGALSYSARVVPGSPAEFSVRGSLESAKAAGVLVTRAEVLAASTTRAGEVVVPHISADCHGGRITGQAELSPVDATNPDGPKRFTTTVSLSRVGLEGVLGDVGSSSEKPQGGRSALIDGGVTLGGITGDAGSRRGQGSIQAGGGEVLSLPLLLPMIQVSNLQIPTGEVIDAATASFFVRGGVVGVERVSVFSPSIELRGFGTIKWPDLSLDLVFNSRAAKRVPVLTGLLEGVRNEIVTTRVRVTAKQPQVSLEQFRSARQVIGELFRDATDQERIMQELEKQSPAGVDRGRGGARAPTRPSDPSEAQPAKNQRR